MNDFSIGIILWIFSGIVLLIALYLLVVGIKNRIQSSKEYHKIDKTQVDLIKINQIKSSKATFRIIIGLALIFIAIFIFFAGTIMPASPTNVSI
jgi:hypothetical protein